MSNNQSDASELTNRMEIFKQLTSDDLTSTVNDAIFKGLLVEFYNDFIEACEYVKINRDKILSVSCYIEMGNIHFSYQYIAEV